MNAADRLQEMKTLYWAMPAVQKDIKDFPEEVKDVIGHALMEVQYGQTPDNAKPLTEFKGYHVWEIRDDYDADTYRAVYTVHFPKAVYVLHVFKKKSKQGIKTPKKDIDLIKARLKCAELDYKKLHPGGK
jgi:phage-related protein